MLDSFALVQALLKNSLCFYTLLFVHPNIEIIKDNDVLYVTSLWPDATYNNVWQTHFDGEIADQRIEDIKQIFGAKNRSLIWWVDPSDTPADLCERLENHGLIFLEQTSIMYRLKGIPLVPYDTSMLTIKKVTTAQELLDFGVVKGGTPEEVAKNLELFLKFILPHEYPITLYVAYANQYPVSIAVTVEQNNFGSIHSFATKEGEQGKGYGTQMLRFLLEKLYGNGCTVALLDSSIEAVKFYEKNGFTQTGKYIKGYTYVPLKE